MANFEIVHIMIANLVTSLIQNCNTHVDPIEMVMFARHILSRTYLYIILYIYIIIIIIYCN